MQVTAILPMKRHSERVPNKNLRAFAGRPLYHSIAAVLEKTDLIKSVLIDTDSKLIAEDVRQNFTKAKIIVRPQELRGDMVSMNKIIAYDINQCDDEYFLQTHSTNPLLTHETVGEAILDFFISQKQYDSLFSVTKRQTRFYWGSGEPVNHNPRELRRTQDLAPVFEENSNLYIFSRSSFKLAGNNRIGLNPKMYIMSKIESLDIDEEDDFILAELLYVMRQQKMK
jgi:CMP-N-acetylneuraminic acid synthetase